MADDMRSGFEGPEKQPSDQPDGDEPKGTFPNEEKDPAVLPRLLHPVADAVARIGVGVHAKLLSGFLIGALLLLVMGILSLVVINRMDQRVDELTRLQAQADSSRQAIYTITAQSHFRAMALATEQDSWNQKIVLAKEDFAGHLDELDAIGPTDGEDILIDLRATDDRFASSGEEVLLLYEGGDVDQALAVHIASEHEISHELEEGLNTLIGISSQEIAAAKDSFNSDRTALTTIVAVVSGVSLLSAIALGLVLSAAFVRPVHQIDRALSKIADGDFTQRVEVPNKDEFGTLSMNLNHTSSRLASLYDNLQSLNQNLQKTVDGQVQQLERANRLKRYLSPQVADSILAGETEVSLISRRRNLTIFFSDIRGFTPLSERIEPEELVDRLNEYLSAMTELVFKHGGTLDKYIGDAIMVFFGDPVPQGDHAQRAVRMALEMRDKLHELQERWSLRHEEPLTIGIGIATGYVTVGDIGSSARSDYTVLGNHVNLASRLADQAKADEILVSERTMAENEDVVHGTEVDQIELEGVGRPVRIYKIEPQT
jgi:class 3 adenylate cyclase/CHASE3 domain sensor protein